MRRNACAVLIASGILLFSTEALAAEGGLVLVPDLPMLVGLLVLFALMVPPVQSMLFAPVIRVLEERAERIDGTRARASRLVDQSADVLARYESSIRSGREEAEIDRKQVLVEARNLGAEETSEARGAAETEIERARNEVAAALETARGGLRAQAEELANQAAERVLGRPLS